MYSTKVGFWSNIFYFIEFQEYRSLYHNGRTSRNVLTYWTKSYELSDTDYDIMLAQCI